MTINLSNVRPDFADLVAQLQSAVQARGSWSDLLTTSTGQTLIELIAAIGAYDQYSIESTMQELFLSSAKLDSSVYAIAKLLGVRLVRKTPARVTVELTRTDTAASLLIPAYTQFTSSGFKLFNRDPCVFNVGQGTITTTLYEGELFSAIYTAIDEDFQSVILKENNFSVSNADIQVFVNGNPIPVVTDGLWHYLDQPAVQDSTTSHGEAHLLFGSSLYGTRPLASDFIEVRYITTVGVTANNGAVLGTTIAANSFTGVTGITVSQLVGGENEPPTYTYRKISPRLYAANDRAVTQDDYEGIALSYPGVIDAMILGQRDISPSDVRYMNAIQLTLLTRSNWNDQDFDTFVAWYRRYTMYSCRFFRSDPIARSINVSAVIGIRNTAAPDEITFKTSEAIQQFFRLQQGTIGFDVHRSDLYNAMLRSHPAIDYVNLITPDVDIISNLVPPKLSLTDNVGALPVNVQYTYTISAYNSLGTTLVNPNQMSIVSSGGGVLLSWTKAYGADGYVIYGRSKLGDGLTYMIDVGDVDEWLDDGSVTPSMLELGPLPALNTSGIYYPVLGTVNLSVEYSVRGV